MLSTGMRSLTLLGVLHALLGQQSVGQTLRAMDSTGGTTRVSIFADGNIRAVATGSNQNSAGTGALGFVVLKNKVQWSGSVNVASTIDTLEQKPGASLLTPATGQAFQSGLLDLRTAHALTLFRSRWGIHAYASAGKSLWAFDSVTVVDALVFGLGGTLFHDFANGKVGDNPVKMTVEIGISARKVGGDVANDSRDTPRRAFLGTESTLFVGLEGGLQLQFNSIVGGIQLYYLRNFKHNTDVDGLTRLQLVGGFSVQGPIFTGILQ